MATAVETPSRSPAILQYALLVGLLIGLGGAVLNFVRTQRSRTPSLSARRVGSATAWAFVPKPATFCAAGQTEAHSEQAHNGYQTCHDGASIADHGPRRDRHPSVGDTHCSHAWIARLDDRGIELGLFSVDESPI